MNQPAEASDPPTFFSLLGAEDLDDVRAILLGRTDFHDDDGIAEVGVSELGVSVMLIGAGIDGQGFDIDFPFTLDQFWREVEEVDRLNLRRVNLDAIPESPLWEADEFVWPTEPSAFDEALAAYFDRHPMELTELIGGGWGTLDVPVGNIASEHFERVWIYAGDPLMVAMGLGRDDLIVGAPTFVPIGMAGPAQVWIDQVGQVDLDAADRFERVAELLRTATDVSRQRCGICWGCRTLQIGIDEHDPAGRSICRKCGVASGVIYD